MNDSQKKIMEWMKLVGQDCPEEPTLSTPEVRLLRARLVLEEAKEFAEALGFEVKLELGACVKGPDFVEAIDALCDLEYVGRGSAVAFGIDLNPFFDEVHASNLSKVEGAVRRPDGKLLKGPNFRPPRLRAILRGQE